MLLISQTMATHNEMPFRALCQLTRGVAGERHALRKTEGSGIKESRGERERNNVVGVFNK